MGRLKEKLLAASAAAVDAWEAGANLSESVAKQAAAHQLDAEQTFKLIHFANTQAHMRLHRKNAGAQINDVSFDVATPEAVLGATASYAAPCAAAKVAGARDAADEAYDYDGPLYDVRAKVASYEPSPMTEHERKVLAQTTPDNSYQNLAVRQRAVDHLKTASTMFRNRAYDAVAIFERKVAALQEDLRYHRIDGTKLASHMVGMYPDEGADICLHVFRGLPPDYYPSPDVRPCGSVVESHPTHVKMAEAVEAHRALRAAYRAYSDLVHRSSSYIH